MRCCAAHLLLLLAAYPSTISAQDTISCWVCAGDLGATSDDCVNFPSSPDSSSVLKKYPGYFGCYVLVYKDFDSAGHTSDRQLVKVYSIILALKSSIVDSKYCSKFLALARC